MLITTKFQIMSVCTSNPCEPKAQASVLVKREQLKLFIFITPKFSTRLKIILNCESNDKKMDLEISIKSPFKNICYKFCEY